MANDRYLDSLGGAAFTESLIQTLAQRAAEEENRRRWQMQHDLQTRADARAQTAQEEQRRQWEAGFGLSQAQDARAAEMHQSTLDQRTGQQGIEDATRRASQYEVGDVVRPEDAEAITPWLPGVIDRTLPASSPSIPMSGAPSFGPPIDDGGIPRRTPMESIAPAVMSIAQDLPSVSAYRGTPEQRQAASDRSRQRAARQQVMGTPGVIQQYIQAREAAGDENLPYQLFEDPGGDVNWQQFQGRRTQSSPLEYFERHPRTGAVRDANTQPVTGVLPAQGYADIPPQVEGRILNRVQQFDNSQASKTAAAVMEHWTRVADVNPDAVKPDGQVMAPEEQAAMDAALIYTYAKAADPNSAVREGEYATVQNWALGRGDAFILGILRVVGPQQLLRPDARRAIKERIGQFANAAVQERNRHIPTLEKDLQRIGGQFGEAAWQGWREETPLPYQDGSTPSGVRPSGSATAGPAGAAQPRVRQYDPATGTLR